jgi:hypothetical protein
MDKSEQNTAGEAAEQTLALPVKKRTVGNIVYDFGVFGSIAWGGVALLSALSAHESMHGKNPAFGWLRTINDKGFSIFKNSFTKMLPKSTNPETIEGLAKGTTMFLTLGMGGNALAVPIKWMEDNRQKNAAHIDNFLGTTPPDPETIAHEPKQTWKSVFSGRLLSWGMSYAAFLAMGPKLTSKINDWFGQRATEKFLEMSPKSNPKTVRRWADIVAFDALFTVITATTTYAMSRAVARHDEEVYEHNHPELKLQTNEAPAIAGLATKYTDKHKSKYSGSDRDHPEFARSLTNANEPAFTVAL